VNPPFGGSGVKWARRHRYRRTQTGSGEIEVGSLAAPGERVLARDCRRRAGASWSDRLAASCARRANRAGVAARRPEDSLNGQELQIAQLAAAGLTNREIGGRLYLSHRTIATNLYRVCPELGVTARRQLSATLSADGPPS
jgi:DNA-binding NarL/FixJ family response regulator